MPNYLHEFPAEVKEAVLIKQAMLKSKKNTGKYSHKKTLIQIVKEWMELSKIKRAS